jgi:hypothetical protein
MVKMKVAEKNSTDSGMALRHAEPNNMRSGFSFRHAAFSWQPVLVPAVLLLAVGTAAVHVGCCCLL